jgi:hypothetical protein
VTVIGRAGQRKVASAADWNGTARLNLRLNRRGMFKFESDLGQVRDVTVIDVAVD